MKLWLVTVAVVSAIGCRLVSADPGSERAVYAEATAAAHALDPIHGAETKQLNDWLSSRNAYVRQAALLVYKERPAAMSSASLAPLLTNLDDEAERPVGELCFELLLPRTETELLAEGGMEDEGRCRRHQQSNAQLAAPLIEWLAKVHPGPDACRQLLANVQARPAHAAVLQGAVGAACPHDVMLQRAASQRPPGAVSQALLELVLYGPGSPGETDLAVLRPVLQSSERRTRELAALLVLLATANQPATRRPEADQAIRDAIRVAGECVDDPACGAVIVALPRIAGRGGLEPLLPRLLHRLGRETDENGAVPTLAALAAFQPTPAGIVKRLVRMLDGPGRNTALAIAAHLDEITARALRPAILNAIGRRRARDPGGDVDLALALGALERAPVPLSISEFRRIYAVYKAGCLNPPTSYHDDGPNHEWCAAAEPILSRLVMEHGL
jgi:hypothetical protein